MTGEFSGKVALVTGGNSGIGAATALAFAAAGAKVVIAARRVDESEAVVEQIKAAGGEALFVQTDVAKAVEVEALIETVVEHYGHLDCAFNNAGVIGAGVSTHLHTEEAWDRIIDINLKGVWLSMKYELTQMLKQGKGVIVNNSSAAGFSGLASAAYGASKHGIIGLTRTAALEYVQQGIRVNAVCPGLIHTPMIEARLAHNPQSIERLLAVEPIGRIGQSAEVAQAVLWLCSDAASFVIGHAMVIDGGFLAQ